MSFTTQNSKSKSSADEEAFLLQMNSRSIKTNKISKTNKSSKPPIIESDIDAEELLLRDLQTKNSHKKNVKVESNKDKPITIDKSSIDEEAEFLASKQRSKKVIKPLILEPEKAESIPEKAESIPEITEDEYLASLTAVKFTSAKMSVSIDNYTEERCINGVSNQVSKPTVVMPVKRVAIDMTNIPTWSTDPEPIITMPSIDNGENDDDGESDDGESDEDESDEPITYGDFDYYSFKKVQGHIVQLSDTDKQTFLNNQRSRGNFDPVAVIDREKSKDLLLQQERERLVASVRGKSGTKVTLTNPDAIMKERRKQELLTKKALKKADKIQKSSSGAQKIKDKNSAKVINKELSADEQLIEFMLKNAHSIKSLSDLGNTTRKLSNMDNVLKALIKLFIVTIDDELKKHLYIEIDQIQSINNMSECADRRALIKFRKIFPRVDEINFCFEKRRDVMKPFSPLYIEPHTLEIFQRQAVSAIDNMTSVVIGAPTSSGKSLISQYLASKRNRTLVILPTQELVDQYAGTVRNRAYKTQTFTPIRHLSGEQIYSDRDWVMLIGTPVDVWRYIVLQKSDTISIDINEFDTIGKPSHKDYNISNTFDTREIEYVIIDELQQMNIGVQGNDNAQAIAMERIVTYFADKVFVMLSATIRNIDHVVKWLRYLKGDFGYLNPDVDTNPTTIGIVYDKRFINQEKRILNNNHMEIMSPLSALTVQLIADGRLQTTEMQFPAQQHLQLARNIMLHHDESTDLDPIVFFDGKSITLQTCKEYEDLMKSRMTNVAIMNPGAMQHILNEYIMQPTQLEKLSIPELYTLLKEMQHNDMMNTIAFIFDTALCRKTCYDLLTYMQTEELKKYPFWYTYRELQNAHTDAMYVSLKSVETAKFSKTNEDSGSSAEQAEDKSEFIISNALNRFKSDIDRKIEVEITKWNQLIFIIKQNEQSTLDIENLAIYEFRIEHYGRERQRYMAMMTLSKVNEYAPHPDYTFGKHTISVDTMRMIKHTIQPPPKKVQGRKAKAKAALTKVRPGFRTPMEYKDPFMLCIERGFSFYTRELKELDERFQGIIQLLLIECGVQLIFSDASLAYGVNLPLRSVLFYNPEFEEKGHIILSRILAHQAGGRSGRRGLDTTGYIVYAGIDYSNLILGEYLDILGVGAIDQYVMAPVLFNSKFCPSKLCKVPLHDFNSNDTLIIMKEKEAIIKKRMINDFRELKSEFQGQSAMHIYRLLECVSNAIEIQDFCMFLALQSFEGKILHKYDFVTAISSLVFPMDHDEGGTFINTQITNIFNTFVTRTQEEKGKLIIHGYSSKITDCYKSNVIDEINMSNMLMKIKIVKEVIRILFSNNQKLTTQWVYDAKQIYIDLNNLVFKHTI
jgi:hypothetical protein